MLRRQTTRLLAQHNELVSRRVFVPTANLRKKTMPDSPTADHPNPHLLRLSLGFVYFYFGLLKFFPDLSPAELLAGQTVMRLSLGHLDAQSALAWLGGLECLIGLGLLLNVLPRGVFVLFLLHMAGTFLPLLLFPEFAFKIAPLAPTLEGQYILKNLVFVAAGWTVLLSPLLLPGILIRWRRKRRGRCRKCAYDLSDLDTAVCPECGWERTKRPPSLGHFPLALHILVLLLLLIAVIGFGINRTLAFHRPPAIHVAAAQADLKKLQAELDRGVDPNLMLPRDTELYGYRMYDSTPLMWAASRGHTDACVMLIQAGANPVFKSRSGVRSPISLAMEEGHAETAKVLRDAVPKGASGTMSMLATAMNSPVEELIRMLARHSWPTENLKQALYMACDRGRYEHALVLIQGGVKPNEQHALAAVQSGSIQTVRLLTEHGLDVTQSTESLLWHACDSEDLDMARALIELGANPKQVLGGNNNLFAGWTPLRRSVIKCNIELLNLLVNAGADPKGIDTDGSTLLYLAVSNQCEPTMIQELLGLGINVDIKAFSDLTPLMLASATENVDAVRLLLEAGADPIMRDSFGKSSVDFAMGGVQHSRGQMSRPSPRIVELLQAAIADPGG